MIILSSYPEDAKKNFKYGIDLIVKQYKSHVYRTEVSQMLHLNLKCELQALCMDNPFGMLHCLGTKISDLLNRQQRRRQTVATSADHQR